MTVNIQYIFVPEAVVNLRSANEKGKICVQYITFHVDVVSSESSVIGEISSRSIVSSHFCFFY